MWMKTERPRAPATKALSEIDASTQKVAKTTAKMAVWQATDSLASRSSTTTLRPQIKTAALARAHKDPLLRDINAKLAPSNAKVGSPTTRAQDACARRVGRAATARRARAARSPAPRTVDASMARAAATTGTLARSASATSAPARAATTATARRPAAASAPPATRASAASTTRARAPCGPTAARAAP